MFQLELKRMRHQTYNAQFSNWHFSRVNNCVQGALDLTLTLAQTSDPEALALTTG